MDFQQELHATNVYLVDEFGDEDDIFYSDLRKQVLQLTVEDEEEKEERVHGNRNVNMVTGQKQGFNRAPRGGPPPDGGYYDWAGNKEDHTAPVWMLNLWRPGNGTGVFIPQAVHAKKKNKSSM